MDNTTFEPNSNTSNETNSSPSLPNTTQPPTIKSISSLSDNNIPTTPLLNTNEADLTSMNSFPLLGNPNQIVGINPVLPSDNLSIYSQFHKATRKEKALYQMFVHHFEVNKRYLDHEFNLKSAAREIGTNEKYLSTAINNCSGMSFNKVVNKYRINYAKSLINQDVLTRLNLEEIAYMSGYGNRTTFYRVFTFIVGITPSRYRDNLNRGIAM